MGVGHAAVALVAARAAPRVNVGWFVFAALLADFLLGVFASMGIEQAHVPADYPSRHYLTFTFPYSHGLVPLLLWGALFGLLASRVQRRGRKRVFLIVAALVVSHFLLDGVVHVVGLPLAGEDSPKFGLALWNHMPLELMVETAMAAVGVALYLGVAGSSRSGWRRWGVLIVMALLTALTWSQLFMSKPPMPAQLVASLIAVPLLFSAVFYALDRKRVLSQATQPSVLRFERNS
jgi:hypothetical protein